MLAPSLVSHTLLNHYYHYQLSSTLTSYLFIVMAPPTTLHQCPHCTEHYTGYLGNHTRSCHAYIWDIPHLYFEKKGPMITVTRNKKREIICKCISDKFGVCSETFSSQSALGKHLKKTKPISIIPAPRPLGPSRQFAPVGAKALLAHSALQLLGAKE